MILRRKIAWIYPVIVLLLLAFPDLQAQKAELMIVRHNITGEIQLQVMNENYELLLDDELMSLSDTIISWIDYDKRYFLNLNNYRSGNKNEVLISLYLNKTPLLIINSDIGPGDHSWPFWSGVGRPELRIVGGSAASITDYPWQVFVRSGNFLCGGTIVADKWVLTAAHCLFDDNNERIPDNNIYFLAGVQRPFDESPENKKYEIAYSVVNEKYNSTSYENDLALLRTEKVIEDAIARPVNLITGSDVASGATDPGVMATITGWGITNVEPLEFPDNLQSLEIPLVSKSLAESVWGPLPDNMLMAGYPNNNGDACSGDSGGPLIVRVGNEYKVAGVISWGSSGCNSIGGYTRLSSFLDWITKNTGVGQDEFRTVRPVGSGFRCEDEPTLRTYISDTLSDAIAYEWKVDPPSAGSVMEEGNEADIEWAANFTGEAYVSVRALTPDGYTNYAGMRVIIGMITKILSVSSDTSICTRSNVVLSVDAIGSDLRYDWYQDNELLVSGSEPILAFLGINESRGGTYYVEVNGSCGTRESDEFQLEVLPLTKIIEYPESQTVNSGASFDLTVISEGDNLNYTWSKDEVIIPGLNGNSINFEDVNANITGLYSVRVDGTCGSKESPKSYVYVDPGISDFPNGVNIWPTLTRDFINIAVNNNEIFDIYVYSSSGIYIGRKEDCRYITEINVQDFTAGVYFIEIRRNRNSQIYRFVKINS